MSLIQSDSNNGHDLYTYLKNVLTRLLKQWASEIMKFLLPRVIRCPDYE